MSEPSFSTTAPVSVMIFTLDEEVNLPACLASLRWCDDVIVVDSFSRDGTEAVCRAEGARFFQHRFEGMDQQRNWALTSTAPKHDWVLILDADERVTPELVSEMRATLAGSTDGIAAYRVRRRFHFWGRWLRHSALYPTWVVRLVHRDRVRYFKIGHGESQETQGAVGELAGDLIDENEKGIDEWFTRQNRYARWEAEHEVADEASPIDVRRLLSANPMDRRIELKRLSQRTPGRAGLYFAYSYVLRGGFREGMDGLVFCTMRAMYQQMIAVKKYDLRRRRGG